MKSALTGVALASTAFSAVTAVLIILGAQQGEQQRPAQLLPALAN